MSTKLNQDAPPAEAPKSGDIVKLDPFPKSDSYVLTLVATNYIAKHPFKREDDNGAEFIVEKPAIEFFFGAIVDGKPYFVKTWPQAYSLHEKANYAKYYEAMVGKAPEPGSKPSEMVGKFALGTIKVEDKVSQKKRTPYRVSVLKSLTAVPSILKDSGTPVDKLRPALDAILAGNDDKSEEAPF